MRQIFSSITYRHKYLSTVLPGCLIFGIFIYLVLSHLLSVDFTVSIILSVILSILLFGLAAYCPANNNRTQSNTNTINHSNTDHRNAASSFVFAITYIALLLI